MKTPFKLIFLFSIVCALFLVGIFYSKENFFNNESTLEIKKPSTSKIINTPEDATTNTSQNEIIVTESELTKIIQDNLGETVNGLTVSISNEDILITGSKKIFVDQNISLKAIPSVKNGEVNLEIIDAKMGPIKLPDSILEKIMSQFKENFTKTAEGDVIENITLQPQKIIIKVRSK